MRLIRDPGTPETGQALVDPLRAVAGRGVRDDGRRHDEVRQAGPGGREQPLPGLAEHTLMGFGLAAVVRQVGAEVHQGRAGAQGLDVWRRRHDDLVDAIERAEDVGDALAEAWGAADEGDTGVLAHGPLPEPRGDGDLLHRVRPDSRGSCHRASQRAYHPAAAGR
ncbi:hypothetical protein GCM10025868_29250 [Angustibacter aerolatus]|uniref:Uncharacterized protein n=1 Tax=Angustibacter aerolatus TaxID=1162965 RepID=A0ABQ6JHG7_9ACTN|nr:hypothetical protein GCM10025868_29250 [Angustibacter aerolatus]